MGSFYIWSGDVPGLVEYFDPEFFSDYHYWNIDSLADPINWKPFHNMHCLEQGLWWKYRESHRGPDTIICGPCSSVLDIGKRLFASNCLKLWDSVISVQQWAGRGQLKRRWSSPVGNIYAALICPPVKNTPSTSLPVILGLCLVNSLADLGVSLHLKWPNDLLLNRQKVGGILVEEKKENIFAGIGINLNRIPEIFTFKNTSALAVQNLQNSLHWVNPASYWQRLVHRVVLWYEELVANEDLQNIAAKVERVMEFLGEEVEIKSGGERFAAKLLGLDDNLGLRIESNRKENVLYNASLM